MVPRAVLLRRALLAVAAVCCAVALAFAPRSVQLDVRTAEPEAASLKPMLWTSQPEKEHKVRPEEEDQRVRRRALRTVGVPGEGLLLAVANSDEDAVDEFGHEPAFLPVSHKHLFPMNRYANPHRRLLRIRHAPMRHKA